MLQAMHAQLCDILGSVIAAICNLVGMQLTKSPHLVVAFYLAASPAFRSYQLEHRWPPTMLHMPVARKCNMHVRVVAQQCLSIEGAGGNYPVSYIDRMQHGLCN